VASGAGGPVAAEGWAPGPAPRAAERGAAEWEAAARGAAEWVEEARAAIAIAQQNLPRNPDVAFMRAELLEEEMKTDSVDVVMRDEPVEHLEPPSQRVRAQQAPARGSRGDHGEA